MPRLPTLFAVLLVAITPQGLLLYLGGGRAWPPLLLALPRSCQPLWRSAAGSMWLSRLPQRFPQFRIRPCAPCWSVPLRILLAPEVLTSATQHFNNTLKVSNFFFYFLSCLKTLYH